MSDIKIHPAAELFPMMSESEFADLKQSISEYGGNREPITFWRGQLIDGRNRLRACEELGIEADADELDEDTDPWQYVIDHNLHRRHLTDSQRAAVAANFASLKRGDNQHSANAPSTEKAAKMLNVSVDAVKRAKTVNRLGSDELKKSVATGEVTVSKAAKVAKTVPKDKQLAAAKEKPKPANQTAPSQQSHEPEPAPNKNTGEFNMSEQFCINISEIVKTQLDSIPVRSKFRHIAYERVRDYVDQESKQSAKPAGNPPEMNVDDLTDQLYDILRTHLHRFPEGARDVAACVIVDVCNEYGVYTAQANARYNAS
jgi:hypothetical protein